ncbi:MAG: oxygenase MpaB family protein [Dehalococcoidia bacterium]
MVSTWPQHKQPGLGQPLDYSFSLQRSRAALTELITMLVGSLPGLAASSILREQSPDRGLFGPDSVTWRVAREPLLLLGGGRALLLQVAHPLVGQAVVDHSDYEQRPYDRLLGTVRWLVLTTFGTTAEAEQASRRIRGIHERVRGGLDRANATRHFDEGQAYAAANPALGRWVLATIVESILVVYEAFVGPLPPADADRFVREWQAAGDLMGIQRACFWGSAAALHRYVTAQIESDTVLPVPASRLAARTVLRPPLPWPQLSPLPALAAFLTIGLLPEPLRRGYGLPWTGLQQRLHAAACRLLRLAHPYLPRKLRISPLYDIALARTLPASQFRVQ